MSTTLQTEEFILEARRLADFYGGVADVLDDPKGEEDFVFLANVFATVKGEANYEIQSATVAHAADLFEHCKQDPEERHKRAFALLRLLHRAGQLKSQQIDELAVTS